MKLFNILKYNIDKPTINLIAGKFGEGKTSLQVILASEAAKKGKNILFLTNDSTPKYILKSLSNLIDPTDKSIGNIYVTPMYLKLKTAIDIQLIEREIDLIFIEDLNMFSHIETLNIMDYFKTIDKTVFISHQMPYNQSILNFQHQNLITAKADSIIGIENKKDFTLIENIKYLLRFWKPKPNKIIKLIKNRNGSEFSKLLHIDIKTLSVS